MEIYTVRKNEIDGRLDCDYYRPTYTKLENLVTKRTNKQLGDYINNISGGATPSLKNRKKYYTDNPDKGVPFLRVQNISPQGIDLTDVKYITYETHNNLLSRSQVYEYDLITKITGVGRMAVSSVAPEGFEGNINQHLVVLQTDDLETSKTLAAFLNSDIGEKMATRRATGATRPALDYQALKSIPIIYCPEIVEIMEEAYSKHSVKQDKYLQAKNCYSGLIENKLNISINISKQRKIFTVNSNNLEDALNTERYANKLLLDKSINWVQIKDIGHVIRDTFSPSKTNPNSDFGSMRIDDLIKNPINPEVRNVKGKDINGRRQKVESGDILVSRLEPSIVNKKTVIAPDYVFDLVASNEFICFRCNGGINPLFVFIVLKTDLFSDLMVQKSRGAVPSRRRLSHEDFKELPFPDVEKDIQDEIALEFEQKIQKAEIQKDQAEKQLENAKIKVDNILIGGEDDS